MVRLLRVVSPVWLTRFPVPIRGRHRHSETRICPVDHVQGEGEEPRVRRTIMSSACPPAEKPTPTRCSDLRLLAVSTHMTELSYSISDIQTRIFGE